MTKARVVKSQPLGDDYYCINLFAMIAALTAATQISKRKGSFAKSHKQKQDLFLFFSFFCIKKEKQGMRTKERTNKQTQDDERDRESFTNGITNPRVANKH